MDSYYMNTALCESKKALKKNNFPVGAVIVKNNVIISKAHNTKNSTEIAINHAEILAIVKACKKLNSWRLNDCTMYVTLEPCPMCMGAIVESRISRVVYLADSNYINSYNGVHTKIVKEKIVDDCQYLKMLSDFFANNR